MASRVIDVILKSNVRALIHYGEVLHPLGPDKGTT